MKVYQGSASKVWLEILDDIVQPGAGELPGYVAHIDATTQPDQDFERSLDARLGRVGLTPLNTVANTIFPVSLWDPNKPRDELYRRYDSIWSRVSRDPANKHGVYFRRIIRFAEDPPVNQAETVIQNFLSGNHRRSAMQVSIYDPIRDLSNSRRRGFPCLQHLVLVPLGGRALQLTAFYATQTVVDKAYGNYVGLIRLGRFFAHSLQMTLTSMTCFTSIGLLGSTGIESARDISKAMRREIK